MALVWYVTKNRYLTAALGAAAAVLLIVLFIVDSSSFENLLSNLLGNLDVSKAFNNAAFNNIFDVSGVVMELTGIGLFVFFTVQSLEKRRWS